MSLTLKSCSACVVRTGGVMAASVVAADEAVVAGASVSGYCVVGAAYGSVVPAFVGSVGVGGVVGVVAGAGVVACAAFGSLLGVAPAVVAAFAVSEGVVCVVPAVVGAAVVEGRAIGVPTSSLTTGADAKGSVGL